MGKYEKLTKFIPVLDVDDIGVWVVTRYETHVEYQEVVFRFCDAVLDFCEAHPELSGEGGVPALGKLYFAVTHEEASPGLLLGYLLNGAVTAWLRELKALDKQ